MKKRNMMKDFKKIIVLVLLFFCTHSLSALVEGSLDASFNSNGLSTLLGSDSTIKAVAIQADGKIVAVGSSDSPCSKEILLVARYNADGSLDNTFGSNGKVLTRFGAAESISSANAVVIQEDGKIVVAGYTNALRSSLRWSLARYNTDGSLDETFFGGRAIFKGTVITFFGNDYISKANALALTADGKIIAAGMSQVNDDKTYFALARYNVDGSLDESGFNPEAKGALAGTVRTTFGGAVDNDQAFAVAIQPNGKIVAGGFSLLAGVKTFALARYNQDGSLDKSFFAPGFARYHGTVVTSFGSGENEGVINSLLIQADGKIVAGGSTNSNSWRSDVSRFALARYDARGILDAKFGGYGLASMPGTVVSTFGAGEGTSRVNALALQGDGKILAAGMVSRAGASHFALARYDEAGNVDCSFNDNVSPAGKIITSLGGRKANEIFSLALDNDGRIIAGGSTDMNGRPQGLLARYLTQDLLSEPVIISPCNNSVIVNGSAVELKGISQNPGLLKIFVNDALVGSPVVKGISNTWRYQLPPLASGNYTLKVLELYAGGNVSLPSQAINIVIDQHPKPINETINTCGLNPVSGILQAQGASGEYNFSIESVLNGTVNLDGAAYTFYPSIAAGQGNFKFKATDSITACSNIGSVNVIINEIPGAIAAQFNTCQNASYQASVASYVSGGNAPFSFGHLGASNGKISMNADGSFNFIPNDGFHGTASFQYQVTDAKGCTSEPLTAYVTVYEAPRAHNTSFTTHESERLSNNINNLVNGGTAPYRFNLVECPGNCAITLQQDGSFTLIPTVGFSGNLLFKYQVTDAHECVSNIATVRITVFESPTAANATMQVCQNGQLNKSLNTLVSKGTPAYIYSQIANAVNGTAVINTDGSFTFSPDVDFVGEAGFKYQVIDVNKSISNVATVTIVVNELPKVAHASFNTCQDTTLQANLVSTVMSGLAPYSFALHDRVNNGTLTIQDDGNFVYIPAHEFNGTSEFQYTVTDANGCTSLVAHATITVWQAPSVQSETLETCANRVTLGSVTHLVAQGLAPYTFAIDSVENGSATFDEHGSYVFTPATDFVGSAVLNYHVVDAHGCISKPGAITFTVHPSPTVANATTSTLENAPVHGAVTSLASGGIPPYTFSLVGESVNGIVEFNSDGTYQFTPVADYYGQAEFSYQITDVHGCLSNTGTVIITVYQLPKVNDHAWVGLANNEIAGSLADLITIGEAPFEFKVVTSPVYGNLVINTDGSYRYTPDVNFAGNDSFQFIIIDAHKGSSNVATVSFNIHEPVKIIEQARYAACQDATINADLRSHVSGGVAPYTFSLITQPAHGSAVVKANGNFSYVPASGISGNDSFMYEVVDALGLSKAAATIEITIYSKPEALETQLSTFENLPITGSLQALVTGGKEAYQFIQVDTSNNGSVILSADGSFTFTPINNFVGTASFMYSVNDANNCTSNAAFVTIQVLELPKTSDITVTGIVNNAVSGSLISQISGGVAPYTFELVNDPVHGTVVINGNGSYQYTPDLDYVGSDSFQYLVVDDNDGVSNLATVSIILHKPVVIVDQKHYSACPNTSITDSLKDVVADGQLPYIFNITQKPLHGMLELSSDGSFVYTPTTGYSGADSFQYMVQDNLNTTAQSSVEITIFEGATVADKVWTIFESEVVQDSLAMLIAGGKPPYQISLLGNASNGSVQLNTEGSFEFVPSNGFIGSTSFQFNVKDANNCVSNVATATINILPLPNAQNGKAVVVANAVINGSLVMLASEGTAPYTFEKMTDAKNGMVVVNPDGSYSYTPHADYSGTDSFTYAVVDAHQGKAIAQINIVIVKPPVITGEYKYYTCENTAVSGDVSNGVVEGVPPYQFELAHDARNGKVIFSAHGSFAYLPNQNFKGSDSFTFIVIDSMGTQIQGTVMITVNEAPLVQDQMITIKETQLSDTLTSLVTAGNPPYTFNQVGHANNSAVVISADGSFSFTSTIEGASVGSFAYQVVDANNCVSNVGTVTVNVNPAPSVRTSVFTTVQDQPLSNSLAPLMMGGNPPFIFSQVGIATNGNLVLSRNGSFIFTPTADFVGDARFNFTATDKNGDSSPVTTVIISVTEDATKKVNRVQNLKNMFKRKSK